MTVLGHEFLKAKNQNHKEILIKKAFRNADHAHLDVLIAILILVTFIAYVTCPLSSNMRVVQHNNRIRNQITSIPY